MNSILTINKEIFGLLQPEMAVEVFRELLWAEATSIGIAKNLLNVPSSINVRDGGIDGEVQNVNFAGGQGIIKQGITRYQIKTGETKTSQDDLVKKILFNESSGALKPRIQACLDKNGTLIVVLFGYDNPEQKDDQLLQKFRDALSKKYSQPEIEIWRQNTLRGFFEAFPSLALRLHQRSRSIFKTHQDWSREDQMNRNLILGESQQERISRIQHELRRNEQPVHVRVWGEAGIGKTRLVLEATRVADLRPLVVYCTADRFRDSDLMNEMMRDYGRFSAILILDECNADNRAYIWNALKQYSPRIKVVSIYNEYDKVNGVTDIDIPPLPEKQISDIIEGYVVPKEKAELYAQECDGSPRVAHVIGLNFIKNPEDLLKAPDTLDIWERYIVGSDERNSQEVRQRRTVLHFLSLFKRFGYGKVFEDEARFVAKLVEKEVSWIQFQEIVKQLRNRKILQGENTLYITPKLLHIYLWINWWETYGEFEDFQIILESMPPTLQDFCFEMFEYAAGSEVASRFVKELLGYNGPFQQDELMFERTSGGKFFWALSKAAPGAALQCLQNTIGTWNKERLSNFVERGYSIDLIWALERIAYRRKLFYGAASLLLTLAEVEEEQRSNHASNTFVKLFYISRVQDISPTEAPPHERFLVIKEALNSPFKRRRKLAVQACSRALSHRYSGPIADIHSVVGSVPQLWTPQTWGELFDAYREVWLYLFHKVDDLAEDERLEACDVLLKNATGLARISHLTEMIVDTIEQLSQKPYVNKHAFLEKILRILRRENLSEEIRQRWESIKNQLTGTDFHALMERYVKIVLSEDHFDNEGNRSNIVQQKIKELAHQAFIEQELLRPELGWLVTNHAKQGYFFGHALAIEDEGFSLYPILLQAQREVESDSSISFFSGYLRRIFEHEQSLWEEILDALTNDEKLRVWIPEIIFRSGKLSDNTAMRILRLIETGVVGIDNFRMFVFGDTLQQISEPIFIQWINCLLSFTDSNDYAIHIALDLYHAFFMRKEFSRIVPEELTLKLLTHSSLLRVIENTQYTQMTVHQWEELGRYLIQNSTNRSLEFADFILEHFDSESPLFSDDIFSPGQSLLREVLRQLPEEIWMRITRYLGPPMTPKAYQIGRWLQGYNFAESDMGSGAAFPLIPQEPVWHWVDEDAKERAPHLARFVPAEFFHDEKHSCWVRELLVRYGEQKAIRERLLINFMSYGWSGSQSLYLQNKRQELVDYKANEDDPNVIRWLDEYITAIERDLGRVKIEEERRGF